MNKGIIVKGNDYSPVSSVVNLSEESKLDLNEYFTFNKESTPTNLGLFYNKSTKERQNLTASRYAGVMPLTAKVKVDKDKKVSPVPEGSYVMITPRFGASATEMLKYIVESDDFYQTTCTGNSMVTFANKKSTEWKEKEFLKKESSVLFGTYSDLPKIKLGTSDSENNNLGFGDLQGIFEIMEFLPACQRVCQQNLKQQSIRREENLVGKMKGKLNLQKQIKHNITSGRVDRNYCIFNQMSIDNKENRILKYALYLVGQAKSEYPNLMEEEFAFCQRALAPVTLEACNLSDFNGLKNNGVFQYYAPAIQAAKKIITRISVTFGADGTKDVILSKDVTPFFIQMDLLFELFCRAVVGNCLKEMKKEMKGDFSLGAFGEEYHIFKGTGIPNGFENTKIPDLVILDSEKKPVAVIDAKYSALSSGNRDRTFQILSYMFLLDCKKGGFMSPETETAERFSIKDMIKPDCDGFHLPVNTGKGNDFQKNVEKNLMDLLDK